MPQEPSDFIFFLIDLGIKKGGMNFNECMNTLDFIIFLDFIEWISRNLEMKN